MTPPINDYAYITDEMSELLNLPIETGSVRTFEVHETAQPGLFYYRWFETSFRKDDRSIDAAWAAFKQAAAMNGKIVSRRLFRAEAYANSPCYQYFEFLEG